MTGASMQSGMEQQVWGPLIPTLLLRQGQPIITARNDIVGSVPDFPDAEMTVLDTYGDGAPTENGPFWPGPSWQWKARP
jgi:hypothetical protein